MAAQSKVCSAKEELAAITARLSSSVGSVPAWLVPATDAGAAKALDDLVSFIANSDVQQALVAAGLPEDQQAKVATALRIVRALPTSHSVRDVPWGTSQMR